MPAGRPAKPTALKELQGNAGKRKLPENEPRYQPGVPVCPSYLSADGKRWFKRVGKLLDRARVITTADRDMLEHGAVAYQTRMQAQRLIKKDGITCHGGDGGLKKHPAVSVQLECQKVEMSVLAQFGLSPSTRSKVQALTEDQPKTGLALIHDIQEKRKERTRGGE